MSDDPASLLTKTQRRRIETDFADVEGAKRRRDQQAIRERIAAGLSDFEYLASYDEDQLAAALEDYDDEELRDVLGDLRIVGARIRSLRDLDGDAVVERARERTDDEPLALETRAERAAAVEASLREEIGPTSWQRRAEALYQVAVFLFVPVVVLSVVAPDLSNGPLGGIPALFSGTALVAGLAITTARGIKHRLVPAARAVWEDPRAAVDDLVGRL